MAYRIESFRNVYGDFTAKVWFNRVRAQYKEGERAVECCIAFDPNDVDSDTLSFNDEVGLAGCILRLDETHAGLFYWHTDQPDVVWVVTRT